MAEHPHVELGRLAWEAVSNADIPALRKLWSPDLVWHATARAPWAGDHQGFDAILDYLAAVGDTLDGFHATLDDILVSDQHLAIVFRAEFQRGERRAQIDYQLLARIEDGVATEVWTAALDPSAVERFWALQVVE